MAKVKADGIWEALFNGEEICLSEEAINEEQRQINQEIFGETRESKTPWHSIITKD